MKKILSILTFALIGITAMHSARAQEDNEILGSGTWNGITWTVIKPMWQVPLFTLTIGTYPLNGEIAWEQDPDNLPPWEEWKAGINSISITSASVIGREAFAHYPMLGEITFPAGLTTIGDKAFYWCNSPFSIWINFPASLTSIGDSAFFNCVNLNRGWGTLALPANLTTIGKEAFRYCSYLTNITIPENVTTIGDGAFSNCVRLDTVNFNAINCTTINDGAFVFYSCPFSTLNIGNGVTNIPNYLFSNCNGLTSLTIPNSVTNIGTSAFRMCSNLSSVTIGTGVESIGDMAFSYCTSLQTITIPNNVTTIGNIAFASCTSLQTVNFNAINCTTMGSASMRVFNGCTAFTTLNIGNGVTNIPNYAFNYCSTLSSVAMPNSITNIGNAAFYRCSTLPSVIIPNSVTTIGDDAFYGCSSLTSITIPHNVTAIGGGAFSGCSSLQTVNFNAINCTNSSSSNFGIFMECPAFTTLNIGNGVTNIPNFAFVHCSSLPSVTIPSSVTNIGHGAFAGCSSLLFVIIPNSVTTIGGSAFHNCSTLSSVTIPNSVSEISMATFADCSSLLSITIPHNVTSIGTQAFGNCSSLQTVNFNAINCTIMGESYPPFQGRVFYNCPAFTTLNIGDSVTNIPPYAFFGNDITSVTIPNRVTSIGHCAFSYCTSLETVTIGTGVEDIGQAAFEQCSSLQTVNFNAINCTSEIGLFYHPTLTTLNIGSEVTNIPYGAFASCTGLTSVTIPNSVISIGRYAFEECTGLTSITIGTGVTSIDYQAFRYCTGLETITCHAVTPPVLGNYAFSGVPVNIPVTINCNSLSNYLTTAGWNSFTNYQCPFTAVTNITGIPTATTEIPLTLSATVIPSNATCQTIIWSIPDAGTSGASITGGNTLNAIASGTATLRATIPSGTAMGVAYTQDFEISITTAGIFCGGNGTESNPFQICDVQTLSTFREYINNGNGAVTAGIYYNLTQDIDLSGYASGEGWEPMGSSGNYFQGNFNGNGKKITNLTINRPETSNIGLFGYTNGADISNIGIENGNLTGYFCTGGLAGAADSTTFSNCYATGSVNGYDRRTGGLVGSLTASSISNCYTTCSINDGNTSGEWIGNRGNSSGGLAGRIANTVVEYCYATGNVAGNLYAGGLIGTSNTSVIRNCVAANEVVSAMNVNVNRIVGFNEAPTDYDNNYAVSNMIVTMDGVVQDRTDDDNVNGTGKPVATLQSFNFYNTGSHWYDNIAWNITNPTGVWKICDEEGFPFLRWQNITCDDDPFVVYTITASVNNPVWGSISPEGEITLEEGESVTFTITPNELGEIEDILVNGISQGIITIYTFENVQSNGTIEAIFKEKVGICENEFGNISIFPNPTTGELTITNIPRWRQQGVEELRIEGIEIFDVYGRNVFSHTANLIPQTVINISHLPAGVYFLRIYNESGFATAKVIKAN